METIGLVSPGAMGASVGAAATGNGHRAVWASAGRSRATQERAARAKLTDCRTLSDLVSESEILLSICPPHAAQAMASKIVSLGFKGIYVDANAISPARSRSLGKLVNDAGCRYVDGGIIGGPAWESGSGTRLYLCGEQAERISRCFANSPLEAPVLAGDIGAASALKMTFAAYTKGSTALLAAILAVAESEGVRPDLEAQWGPELTQRAQLGTVATSAKAWRFVGEMQEIADTFREAGLPGDFHQAAAEIYARLEDYKDASTTPTIEQLLTSLLKG